MIFKLVNYKSSGRELTAGIHTSYIFIVALWFQLQQKFGDEISLTLNIITEPGEFCDTKPI